MKISKLCILTENFKFDFFFLSFDEETPGHHEKLRVIIQCCPFMLEDSTLKEEGLNALFEELFWLLSGQYHSGIISHIFIFIVLTYMDLADTTHSKKKQRGNFLLRKME